MLRKLLVPLVILLSISVASAISIEYCRSDTENWLCNIDETCECRVLGTCTNGNLVVYESNPNNPLCLPRILPNGIVSIDWYACPAELGILNIKADCNEGQSAEYGLILEQAPASTTSTTTTSTTTTSSTTTTIRKTTTTTPPSSGSGRLIGILLIVLALVAVVIIIYLKNKRKSVQRRQL